MDRLHRTRRPRLDSLLLAAVWIALTSSSLLAQDIPPAPAGDPPANPADTPQQLPKELEAELLQWANATKDIPKLEGEHTRWIYDHVFQVEKRAVGSFYYEAPDKGRIDLEPDPKVRPGAVNSNKIGKNGKPFTIQPDQAEKWICDGQTIMQINDDEKTYETIQIPPQNQGHNIMDGPLPFLFGMPPEQAKKRYWLKLARPLNANDPVVWIEAKPRWRQDAANYQSATIILSRQTYLPAAVKLMDPAGTQETVYQFKFNTGKFGGILQKLLGRNNDPFKPDLAGYRKLDASVNVQHAGGAVPPGALPGAVPSGENPSGANPNVRKTVFLPSLIGMPWKDADKIIKSAGLEPKFAKGPAAPKPEQVYQVYQQEPPPKTAVEPGTEVRVVLFTEVAPTN